MQKRLWMTLPWFLGATAAGAQANCPDRPIRLVIGSAPGGGPDIISGLLADRLYERWGQRIVVDARPGVAGVLSAGIVNRCAADGYTSMMMTTQLFVATMAYKDQKVNFARDFASVGLIGRVPFAQGATPIRPAKSVPELVELPRKSNSPLRHGSAGTGAAEHLAGLLFNSLTKTNVPHVPYRGVGQTVADVIAREMPLTHAVLPMIQAQRVRAPRVTSAARVAAYSGVPTSAESVPGCETCGG